MDLIAYYRHYNRLLGYIGGVISLAPFVSVLPLQDLNRRVFPPLGGHEPVYALMTFVCLWLSTLLVYSFKDSRHIKRKRNRSGILLLLSALVLSGFVAHGYMRERFVCEIESSQYSAIVSIGFSRTEFARKNFADYDDCGMVRQRGPNESQIRKLWTPTSIAVTRIGLATSYLAFFFAAMAILSFTILFDAIEKTSDSRKVKN